MIRQLCRALMAGVFIQQGVDALRHPGEATEATGGVAVALADRLPVVSGDRPEVLVMANGAAQVAGGAMLLADVAPRASAAGLAVTMVPVTFGEHAFWTAEKGEERRAQLRLFLRDLAIIGGLMITAMDTEGQPGLVWRAGRLGGQAAAHAEWRRREAELLAQVAQLKARNAATEARARGLTPARQRLHDLKVAGRTLRHTGRVVARSGQRVRSLMTR